MYRGQRNPYLADWRIFTFLLNITKQGYITPEAYKRNTGLMLAQCCTRWANIRRTLAQRTMFADIVAK